MARDPKMFPDYDVVRPERYIDPKTGDLNNTPFFSFGFGRRSDNLLTIAFSCLIRVQNLRGHEVRFSSSASLSPARLNFLQLGSDVDWHGNRYSSLGL
jgi:hypothetical protein